MTTDLGQELAQATLGLDRLYRNRATGNGPLDREGLVAVPPADVEPALYMDWVEADAALCALQGRLREIGKGLRRDYVAEMLESLRCAVAVFRGEAVPYVQRVERCLRVPGRPVPQGVMDGYRRVIDTCLRELGYAHGTLAERVTRWEAQNQVPPAEVPSVLGELLQVARRRTEEKVMALPASSMEIMPVGLRNVPFSAYCDYANRQLKVNLDYVYTRTALKHLACHEAFPGHLLHMAVREQRARDGLMPADAPLVVVNSASSAVFEGIGENGMAFLDWVESPADTLGMTLNRLRSAARVNAALMIHHEGASVDAARVYLSETCFTTPAWVESRLGFLTHSLRAPFIFAYWYGDAAVDAVWRQVPPSRRSAFFRFLYHHMHTPTTLATYWPAFLADEDVINQ